MHGRVLAILIGVLVTLSALRSPSADGASKDFDAALKSLDAARKSGHVSAIRDAMLRIGELPDRGADQILRKIVSHDRDDEVVADAAWVLADRGAKSSLRFLSGQVKPLKKRPVALTGVIVAIGMYRNPSTVDLLFETTRNQMTQGDKDAALAGIEALRGIPTKAALDRLIEAMSLTSPFAIGVGRWALSEETYRKVKQFRKPLRAALTSRTDVSLKSAKEWRDWWREVEGKYRTPKPLDLRNQDLQMSVPGRFEIRRPSDSWRWLETPEDEFEWTAVRELDGRRVAWVSLHIHSVAVRSPQTVGDLVTARRKVLEKSLASIESPMWGEAGLFAGRKMTFHQVTGIADGGKLDVFEGCFRVRHRLHVFRGVTVHGLPETVRSELTRFRSTLRIESRMPIRR